jgi:hypothetical protein
MRERLIKASTLTGLVLLTIQPLAAEQRQTSPPQSSLPDQENQADAAAARVTSAPRMRLAAAPRLPDSNLDADDQLAPSQMKQPMPSAVPEPNNPSVRRNARPPSVRPVSEAAPEPRPAAAPEPHPAAAAPAPSRLAASRTVTCSGPFAKDSSNLTLAMVFDSRNVTFTQVDGGSAGKIMASVIFPKDPKRRLEVWWSDPASRMGVYLVVINGQSSWTAPGGMRLGLTLAELEKLNHKPFKVKGFDKDNVATVSDWDGGTLATIAGGCKSGLSLRADAKAPTDAVSAFPADHEYSSSDPALRAIKARVSEVLIGY